MRNKKLELMIFLLCIVVLVVIELYTGIGEQHVAKGQLNILIDLFGKYGRLYCYAGATVLVLVIYVFKRPEDK